MALLILGAAALNSGNVSAARISDITNTKHNLSVHSSGANDGTSVKAVIGTWQNQVCIFCHTPHGSTLNTSPLWNRKLSTENYTPYTSNSLDAQVIWGTLDQPGGSSKLCLSCHDGTLAIGNLNTGYGWGSSTGTTVKMIMLGTEDWNPTTFMEGKMPYGGSGAVSGVNAQYSGATRRMGTDLTNDHPISLTYTAELADRDGELRGLDASQMYPATTGEIIGKRSSGYRPKAPLEPTGPSNVGQVQCSTCHDPHLRETDATLGNQKFLRLNRFQQGASPSSTPDSFDLTNDIGCLACHKNNADTTVWANSVHAKDDVSATPQTYKTNAATRNEFPTITANGAATNLPVWQASCLNCHDTHTVAGSRRLLREGVDSASTPDSLTPKAGGVAAGEETCYQCHTSPTDSAVEGGDTVHDIKADFALNVHMPIASSEQDAGTEVHDISAKTTDTDPDCNNLLNKCGADFIEQRTKLGVGNLNNRHAECTDCHNPHRILKNRCFNGKNNTAPNPAQACTTGSGPAVADDGASHASPSGGTPAHPHDATDYTHTNIASGALRGTYGVEPTAWEGSDFFSLPTTFDVKRGDPNSTDTAVTNTYVTREYQICLKCHSNYGYTDDNGTDAGATVTTTRPALQTMGGSLTPSGTNGLLYYTNQAREFQAPLLHMGETSGVSPATSSGADPTYQTTPQTNYRSWHPVMDSTGRTGTIRGNGTDISSAFLAPWGNTGTTNAVGNQTMYCSDCHGPAVASATSVDPDSNEASRKTWGPHGSDNEFLLKGLWNTATGDGAQQSTGLCFKCHDYSTYAAGGGGRTGFFLGGEPAGPTQIDGHTLHYNKIIAATGGNRGMRCDWCHTMVPHGFKNKGLLVNLNDIGPEASGYATTGNEYVVIAASGVGFDNAPYYKNARLKVLNFAPSGQWKAADCGSAGAPGNGLPAAGKPWMTSGTETCTTPP